MKPNSSEEVELYPIDLPKSIKEGDKDVGVGEFGKEQIQILVVDDEPAVRATLKAILKKSGYSVEVADSFDSAVELAEKNTYAVIITDIILPGSSGIDILKRVRKLNQDTQLITITGDPNLDTATEAVRAGAYDYIAKPIRREVFLAVVERAVQKAALLCEKKKLEEQNLLYQKQLEKLVEQRTEQLKASELKYRTLFESANDSIFLLESHTGKISDINEQAIQLTGRTREDLLGESFWTIDSATKSSRLKKFIHDLVKKGSGDLDDVELNLSGKGKIRADLSGSMVELGEVKQVQVMIRDVTDKKMLEEKHREMEIELVQEQKLASIGMMSSGIAHNINSPLMGIIGLCQFIMMKNGESEELKSIIEQANKISTIVKNLMFKSRSEQEKVPGFIDMNRLLQEELKFLESDLDFKHNVEKEYHYQEPLPEIRGVYSDFSQSITNIIRNAIDAMYDTPRKCLTVRTGLEKDWILVNVEDTGCGIEEENIPQLFNPFFTTKPIRGKEKEGQPTGTGLGLSSAYKLLSPYGVKFDIESKVGKGTKFMVRIPIGKRS
jgi:two-component system sporulation sensor kinase A